MKDLQLRFTAPAPRAIAVAERLLRREAVESVAADLRLEGIHWCPF